MKIVLAGGNGQVGTLLARHFSRIGNEVIVLSRSASSRSPWRVVQWDGRTLGPWSRELEGADAVINLAGKTINCRYTTKNRSEIIASRVESTEAVGSAIQATQVTPKVWINASAAGIYRHSTSAAFTETTTWLGGEGEAVPETWRFAAEVVKTWENTFDAIEVPGVRKIALRTTLAISPDKGGVFDVLLGLVRYGLGGTQGPGTQFISWMHDKDYVRAVEFMIGDESISGPVNMGSPVPLPNAEFMRILRKAAGVKIGLSAPEFALKIGAPILGTEAWLVLKSINVLPGVLERAGFDFQYPEWDVAARNMVRRWKQMNG
ncbi:TIGR01777 family oxidoreductase [Terriglobus saanensis]|uniref:NAD-dependent epimerase/dehydratase n=1 Tax=Terriglobus saanensis (strain ATCC BAA-1853 / DSM 23119 / SP1PR4) TaxID=401053 RepID=E8V5P8_TERSS|nr:TIGR01777 family oxidoreductase [Terriglobus saanensis]ADV82657.1 NAD-dependent epimerase/dehydratase [Terriglobus saanensis SP1PR4]